MKYHIIDGVRRCMGFLDGFNVAPVRKAGRLSLWWDDSLEVQITLWWDETLEVQITYFSKNIIDAHAREIGEQNWVRFRGSLGVSTAIPNQPLLGSTRTSYRAKKEEFWGWMNSHFTPSSILWLYVGGGGTQIYNQPRYLANFINCTKLMDLEFNGPAFTWKGIRNGDLIEEHIDRGFLNYH
ncbi:hypothetical protein DVH24_010454 [Malus domestica]|uniref:Uncharacterized protein n=1 Tax=Malus domestica TaxID=3750 RepID=A0A498JQA9_MALDO|nr:hypothetical protein DVH24_010454 [Malus domestica]